ncbi:MAG TPA: hypothetical protein VKV20_04615 [Ktedonobacteraceae bacterium]|nr:hypothetical protein [Ktedonobacteraceae bacterium]
MGNVLIAFDTDHIKGYVFGTDTLKEIRGGSSRLDRLNRDTMNNLAQQFQATRIFTNGGAGLFVVDEGRAEAFGKQVQKAYRDDTGGGSSITYAIQPLPENAPGDRSALMDFPMRDTLAMMRYALRQQKDCPSSLVTQPSHPFMYLCDSCGVEYAGKTEPDQDVTLLLCESCYKKRVEDWKIKNSIEEYLKGKTDLPSFHAKSPLWADAIKQLEDLKYEFPEEVDRPQDFNVFSAFKGSKDYFALIYADGNNMGQEIEKIETLSGLKQFADNVDDAVKWAVSDAIAKHLQVKRHLKPGAVLPKDQGEYVFPFDILLLGGDDVVMVTPASVALDVAMAIANNFHEYTKNKYSLSVGVVLAPIKYPFGLLLDLAESTLKFAKDERAKRNLKAKEKGRQYEDTGMINFVAVPGSVSRKFKKVYSSLEKKSTQRDFYATLRPYDTQQLEKLLKAIHNGHKKNLGRTKLHQLREAILELNLTTSLSDARALWRNWRQDQREIVIGCLHEFANEYERQHYQADDPSLFYERPFPWFADGKDDYDRKVYRTPLLDFVELYDFVTGEEANGGDED